MPGVPHPGSLAAGLPPPHAGRTGHTVLFDSRIVSTVASNTWQIDVYEGLLEGVVLAETDADQKLTLPDWIGEEVTADPTYRKINMVASRFAKLKVPDKTTF